MTEGIFDLNSKKQTKQSNEIDKIIEIIDSALSNN